MGICSQSYNPKKNSIIKWIFDVRSCLPLSPGFAWYDSAISMFCKSTTHY